MIVGKTATLSLTVAEWREFASFSAEERDYIHRALDIGLARRNALQYWVRKPGDTTLVRDHREAYRPIAQLKHSIPSEHSFEGMEVFMGTLLRMTAFDLSQGALTGFSAYRFLYERLLGAAVRPWLASAFCGAAALPQIRPDRRKGLLQSLSQAAATAPAWSEEEPSFYPDHLDDEKAA